VPLIDFALACGRWPSCGAEMTACVGSFSLASDTPHLAPHRRPLLGDFLSAAEQSLQSTLANRYGRLQ